MRINSTTPPLKAAPSKTMLPAAPPVGCAPARRNQDSILFPSGGRRLWLPLLFGFFGLAASALAFHWDNSAATPLSTPGAYSYRIVDGSSDALAVWRVESVSAPLRYGGLLYSTYSPSTGWSGTGIAVGEPFDSFTQVADDFDVSMNSRNDFVIVGVRTTADPMSLLTTRNEIYASLVIGGVQSQFRVTDHAWQTNVTGGSSYAVKGVISGNGDAMVAWEDVDAHQLLARVYRGGSWQPEFVLAATDVSPFAASLWVSADEFGSFIVVWNPGEVGAEGTKIYCRRYVSGAWLGAELVGQSEGLAGDKFPRVGMYGRGGAIVAWWHSFATYNGIAARRFDGSSWSGLETLDNGSAVRQGPPDIAVQPDGKAVVLFPQGTAQSGSIYANRFADGAWSGPVDIGCGGQGMILSVDMDGNGNAVAAFMIGSFYYWHAYQEGLGWLGCSAQGLNSQSASSGWLLLERRDKKVVLTPHQVIGVWETVAPSEGFRVSANQALKDIRINGFAVETQSPVVDLQVKLPFNSICGATPPYLYQEMRFSNDGTHWSSWEPAPTTAPYAATKTGWDLSNPAYGGTSAPGLKRAYIQFRNANCDSLVTHDEILLLGVSPSLFVWQDSPRPASPYASWATAAHTIQEAVDAAQPGQIVVVTNGVYATGGRAVVGLMTNRVAIDKAITVRSVNGPAVTLIEGAAAPGGGNGDGAIRCAYVGSGAVLSGFTLTNGHTRTAGTLEEERSGGGVWSYSGQSGPPYPEVNNCILTGNSAAHQGGGAFWVILRDCVVAGNAARGGGGTFGSTLHRCTVTSNTASLYGGGVMNGAVSEGRLTGNSANSGGGGAYNAQLYNCLLNGNVSSSGISGVGGGAYGGTLYNCTLVGNRAGSSGGISGGTLVNCIVYNNTRLVSGADNWSGATFTYSCTTPLPSGAGNISADPLFVSRRADDFHLGLGSPCIDTGTDLSASITTDLDGSPRPLDGDWNGTPAFDMGAYEAPPQGTVRFANLDAAAGLQAPIYGLEPGAPCVAKHGNTASGQPAGAQTYSGFLLAGARYTAQLFHGSAGATENALVAHSTTTSFASSGGFFVEPAPLTFPVPAGVARTFQVRVWDNQAGTVSTWDQVLANPSLARGKSELFTLVLGGGGLGTPPPALIGLRSFNLHQPLAILSQPEDRFVVAGTRVIFQVKACGSSPLRFRWSKDGAPITDDGRIVGSTTAVLTIANAGSQDAGGYRVTVSDADGSVVSTAAILAVVAGGNGVVYFRNRATAVRAPVYGLEPANPYRPKRGNTATGIPAGTQTYGGPLLAGASYTAQLFYGTTDMPETWLVPAPVRVPFSTGSLAGYFNGPPVGVTLPMPPEMNARLQVRAWDNRGGTVQTWDQAVADVNVARGSSAPITVALGVGGIIPPPELIGLESFSLHVPLQATAVRQDGNLILSWPAGLGIRLQKTSDLSSPNWQDVPGTDLANQISIPLQEEQAFYRLMLPNPGVSPGAASP